MVVSYMYVLEVHTGAILKIAVQRTIGTFIGSVAAYVVCPLFSICVSRGLIGVVYAYRAR